jgi:hypothetical protein
VSRYDVTIQWTDRSCDPGYQEAVESAIVEADSADAAFAAARSLRPLVSSVQVHGVAGTAIAFDGPGWRRMRRMAVRREPHRCLRA